eukprot:34425_1
MVVFICFFSSEISFAFCVVVNDIFCLLFVDISCFFHGFVLRTDLGIIYVVEFVFGCVCLMLWFLFAVYFDDFCGVDPPRTRPRRVLRLLFLDIFDVIFKIFFC